MKFSIVIPNFNNEKYLNEAIESAITALPEGQGEIVIVDDCSTDNSLEIANKYAQKMTGVIKVFQNESNLGQELTTNKCLELSKGDYAVILHSDDLIHENFFFDLAPLLERFPSAVMAVGERIEINADSEKIHSVSPFYDNDYFIPGREQARTFLYTGFLPCQVLFKRNNILSFGGAKKNFIVNLDGLLWFKLALSGDVAYTQTSVCSYRKHETSTTTSLNHSISHMFEYYATLKEMFNFSDEMGVDFSCERSKAFLRVSELSLRYAKEIYTSGNEDLTKQYMSLALSINPDSKNSLGYKELENLLKHHLSCKKGFAARQNSYTPPKGSVRIETLIN